MVPISRVAQARQFLPLFAVLAAILAACGSEVEPSTDPSPQAQSVMAAATTACAEASSDPAIVSEWSSTGAASGDVLAVIVSSNVSVGPNRFLYTIADPDLQIIASPDTQTQIQLVSLDGADPRPALEAEGEFLDTGTGRGVYRANVVFPCSGTWGAEIVVPGNGGKPNMARTVFRVTDGGPTPAIGAPAPRSDNLTASTVDELRQISTDPEPRLDDYRSTIRDAVTSGRPSVVFFATPAFCQSGVCGPTVEMVKAVLGEYRGEVEYVTVEPYQLRLTPNGLQPELDEQGRLQAVDAAVEYGIPVEPYLFVVDADGNVAAKFEVVVGEDELRAVLQDLTRSSTVS